MTQSIKLLLFVPAEAGKKVYPTGSTSRPAEKGPDFLALESDLSV